jgi:RNA polymerase sigma-70 factor (ECF subfamily)
MMHSLAVRTCTPPQLERRADTAEASARSGRPPESQATDPGADGGDEPDSGTPLDSLLAAVATGDRRAFRRVYDLTSRHLLGVALRVLRDRDLAEEVLQDAFLKVWQRAASFEAATSKPMTWLISIVRNRAIDIVRARRPEAMARPTDDEMPEIAGDVSTRPDALLEIRRLGSSIDRGLERMNASQRQALTLIYRCGMTYQEVAAALGAPLGTVKVWVRLGLDTLRCQIDPA